MAKKKKPMDSNDDEVGYGNPPKHSQFKPGESGNPKGRPKKTEGDPTEAMQILNEPISIKRGRNTRKIIPFEFSIRVLVKKVLKEKDLRSTLELIKIFEKYEIIMAAPPSQEGPVLTVPKDWEIYEWVEMYEKHGLPPWPGKRSGLVE